jgi:hypothetical protein
MGALLRAPTSISRYAGTTVESKSVKSAAQTMLKSCGSVISGKATRRSTDCAKANDSHWCAHHSAASNQAGVGKALGREGGPKGVCCALKWPAQHTKHTRTHTNTVGEAGEGHPRAPMIPGKHQPEQALRLRLRNLPLHVLQNFVKPTTCQEAADDGLPTATGGTTHATQQHDGTKLELRAKSRGGSTTQPHTLPFQ